MNRLAKELIATLISIFILAFFLQLGWNAFFWDFLGLVDQMTYGAAIGFWMIFFSFSFTAGLLKAIFSNEKRPLGSVNIHHHYNSLEEETVEETK